EVHADLVIVEILEVVHGGERLERGIHSELIAEGDRARLRRLAAHRLDLGGSSDADRKALHAWRVEGQGGVQNALVRRRGGDDTLITRADRHPALGQGNAETSAHGILVKSGVSQICSGTISKNSEADRSAAENRRRLRDLRIGLVYLDV